LSQIENSNSLPSLYKLASLSEIYRVPYAALLRVYGIETETRAAREVELSLEELAPSGND
jgi:transcriptional regulator with XRE-family HTH domain